MKYFSKHRITREQIVELKKLRRRYVKTKNISYSENFYEVNDYEKSIRIMPKEDDILQLIKDYLEPWVNGMRSLDNLLAGKSDELYYDYDRLPPKLKSYMYSVDALLFEHWYKRALYRPSEDEYDERMDKLKRLKPDFTSEDFERYVMLGHPLPSPIGRKAKESARRAYNTVNGILKANINRFDTFMTFTFAHAKNKDRLMELNASRKPGEESLEFVYVEATDFEKAKDAYSMVMEKLVKQVKRRGSKLEYLTVWELQKNGNYHFHTLSSSLPMDLLYDMPEWLDLDYKQHKRNYGKGVRAWTYGKSDVQKVDSYEKMSTYVSKYILKSFLLVNPESYDQYLNQKKFYTSRGLNRPIVDYEEEIDQIKIKGKQPYIKGYKNPYNGGSIQKQIYTLIEKKEPQKEGSQLGLEMLQ